jgi:hypothetical protein
VVDTIVGRDLIQADGPVTIGEEPPFRLERFVPGADVLPPARAVQSPSRLLRARYETVRFAGREPELAALADWRDRGADGVSVLLVHGPGGQGKTRLARRFAGECAREGWRVWQARRQMDEDVLGSPDDQATADPAGPEENARGTLVLVDYSERWSRAELARLLRDPLLRDGPVRLLLIARPTGVWWQSLRTWLEEQLGLPTAVLGLGPLGLQISRHELFVQARDRFADIFRAPAAARIAPPADLDDDDGFSQVLAVHMAALAAVDAHHHDAAVPDGLAQVSAYLLARERAHWDKLHTRAHQPMATSPRVMGRAVYTATLAGPLPWEDGVQVLRQARVASSADGADAILADHGLCYPCQEDGLVLAPLYPDRLGEDFVVLSMPGHPLADRHPPDPWAESAVERLLAPDAQQAPPDWAPRSVTVLVAAAARWPHLRPDVNALLRRQPQLVSLAGGATLATLSELPGIDLQLLATIKSLGYREGSAPMR